MDRNTLSVYAWVIIAFIIFAVLFAFATPFTDYAFGQMENLPGQVAEAANIGNCDHSNTDTRSKWVKYSSTQHQEYIETYCTSCNKVLATAPTSHYENHTYNSSYICTACGYRHNHIFDTVVSQAYEQIVGDTVYHNTTVTSRCVCGLTKTETYREVHHYVNSRCSDCGYINPAIGSYMVLYDANGGENAPEGQAKLQGVNLTLSSDVPTKMYGIFQGWGTTRDAVSPTYQPGDTYDVDADITLYAVWTNLTPLPASLPNSLSWKDLLTYNGSSQSANNTSLWDGYDSGKMTMGGTTSRTNAGTYTATFAPKEGYCWSDGTVTAVSKTWTIKKAYPVISASSKTVSRGSTVAIGVTVTGGGTVSYSSNATSIATVDSNGIITGVSVGHTQITISVAASTNYNSNSVVIDVTVTCTEHNYQPTGVYSAKGDLTHEPTYHDAEMQCSYCGDVTWMDHEHDLVSDHIITIDDQTYIGLYCTLCEEFEGELYDGGGGSSSGGGSYSGSTGSYNCAMNNGGQHNFTEFVRHDAGTCQRDAYDVYRCSNVKDGEQCSQTWLYPLGLGSHQPDHFYYAAACPGCGRNSCFNRWICRYCGIITSESFSECGWCGYGG